MNRLKELRQEAKMTQKEVADFSGVSKSTYYYWESGQYEPDQQTLIKLAEHFGVTTDYLLGRTQDKEDKKIAPGLSAKSDQYYIDLIHKAGITDEQANNLSSTDLARIRGYVEGLLDTKKDQK